MKKNNLKTGINAENGASSNFWVKVWRTVSAMPAFCCNLISIRFLLIPPPCMYNLHEHCICTAATVVWCWFGEQWIVWHTWTWTFAHGHTHTHTKWLTEFSAHFLDWCIESLFPLPWRVISKYQEWKQIIYLCYKNDCRRHIAQLDPAFYKRENATRCDRWTDRCEGA